MAADAIDLSAALRLRAPIVRWYRRAKRDLPWRRTTDPYAIWVSEVMLQQTTVAAVIPYWERFLDRFPDAASLAAGREDDVLALWSGLGYYRRAKSLRHGAIAVMESHGGRVPESVDSLLDLPGVGRYTAGAIASLAFGHETPVVDGNVKRVFSRLFAMRGQGAAAERTYWSIAEVLVRGPYPGEWNQALMELGATICTPRSPRCGDCPVTKSCRARALSNPEAFPTAIVRPKTRIAAVAVAWLCKSGRVLLERQHADGPLRGSWDLPATFARDGETPGRAIARALFARHGVRIRPGGVLLTAKHAILNTRLDITVIEAGLLSPAPRRAALRFADPKALNTVPISGATAKIARQLLTQRRSQRSRPSSSSASASSGRAKA